MNPSLGGNDQQTSQLRPTSPEPLSEEDIVRMRNQVVDMGLSLDTKSQHIMSTDDLTLKEKELGGMVVKLLDSFVDPSQLHRQAEFISWLGAQRDLLVQSFEEERRRWEAEREGWTRMAEALLSQRARAGASYQRDEDLERQCATYETENKTLREKLQDSHSRFSALEHELSKLKPLLLMQPSFPSTTSLSERTVVVQPSLESSPSKVKPKADPPPVEEQRQTDSSTSSKEPLTTPKPNSSTHLSGATPSQPRFEYYRRHLQSRSFLSPLTSRFPSTPTPTRSIFSAMRTPSTHLHSSKKSRSKHKKYLSSNLPPLTADARTEHLLLAARKIGRERANEISGLMRHIEKEKEELMRESEQERMDRERSHRTTAGNTGGNAYYRKDLIDLASTAGPSIASAMPKTPKRGTTGGQPTAHFLTPTLMTPRSDIHPPTNQIPSSFVFVGTPAVTSYQTSATSTPQPVGHAAPAAQSATKTPTAPSSSTSHPTPLASLLSAAKSMMDDESNETITTSNSRRRTVLEPPESPIPKRRKVGNGTLVNGRGSVDMLRVTPTPGSDRVRSALDVLADQAAAAFDSDWQSPPKQPAKPPSRNKGKDKTSTVGRSAMPSGEEMDIDTTPKGRTRSNSYILPNTGSSTGSPVSTRSRSKALLTDRLSKDLTKAPQHRKVDKSIDQLQRSAPVPRMIFSPGTRSPIPSHLSPSSVPSTPPNVSTENTSADLQPVHTESRRDAVASVFDASPVLPNDDTSQHSKPPISPSMEDDCCNIPSSPSLAATSPDTPSTHVPQQVPVNPSPFTQDTNRAEDTSPVINKSAMTSVAENENDHRNSHEENTAQRVMPDENDEEETGDKKEDGQVAQSHAPRSGLISDEDGPDTDADAEGEMDVDAEETVIMNTVALGHEH
ncbi:hypothetical protein AN958_06445 [Leucoagaricus sp. SymC.cos]|nr:hypothetical protein AN958_06445 [Leucoagaricus sp. SymC.cos]